LKLLNTIKEVIIYHAEAFLSDVIFLIKTAKDQQKIK
jgi:hypothetical protein